MPKIKITNLLKFYTMTLLSCKSLHGYELIKELSEKLDRRVSTSNVYPFLSQLRKNRLIKFDKIENREKKVYSLTPEGKKFTAQMFSKFGDLIDISIAPKLTVCAHCGCKVYEGGHTEKIRGETYKFCCCHCARSYKKQMQF